MRRLHDGTVRRGCQLSPRATFALAATAAGFARSLGLAGFSTADVAAIYGGRTTESPSRIARRMAAASARIEALDVYIRETPTGEVARLIEWARPPTDLPGPAIFVGCHTGPIRAFGPAFRLVGVPLLVLVRGESRAPLDGVELVATTSAGAAIMALDQAYERLRNGGFVLLFIDSDLGTSTEPVPMLGRTISFRRGAFRLAHSTGAPIHPVTIEWTAGPRPLRATVHERLSVESGLGGPQFEARAAEALAAWLERYLIAHPYEHYPSKFRRLLAAPTNGRYEA